MLMTFFAALLPILNPVDAIVTDIEGTTTSISFVHDTLFPYAKQHVQEYVETHENEPNVRKILKEVQELASVSSEEVVSTLLTWMEQDKKITPLKTLQGLMWEDGYRRGAFQGHVYEDAYEQMKQWKGQGIPLYVYSSGSVFAQNLLFSHSTHGDMSPLFSNYFDTKIGGKKESASYRTIAEKIGIAPEQILFLSDSIDELNAAREVGIQTILLCRDDEPSKNCDHPSVTSFYEISIP
jgi:enolase-phosphatase E1